MVRLRVKPKIWHLGLADIKYPGIVAQAVDYGTPQLSDLRQGVFLSGIVINQSGRLPMRRGKDSVPQDLFRGMRHAPAC